jgi:hypothetical protein
MVPQHVKVGGDDRRRKSQPFVRKAPRMYSPLDVFAGGIAQAAFTSANSMFRRRVKGWRASGTTMSGSS